MALQMSYFELEPLFFVSCPRFSQLDPNAGRLENGFTIHRAPLKFHADCRSWSLSGLCDRAGRFTGCDCCRRRHCCCCCCCVQVWMKHTEQHSHPSLKAATWIYTNTYYFSSMWSRLCYTQSCRIAKCTWIYLCANVSQLPLVVSRSHFCWHVFFYSFQKTCLDMNLTARRRSSI